eukprot:3825312-Pleurochrysis_carterae.AAC.1
MSGREELIAITLPLVAPHLDVHSKQMASADELNHLRRDVHCRAAGAAAAASACIIRPRFRLVLSCSRSLYSTSLSRA